MVAVNCMIGRGQMKTESKKDVLNEFKRQFKEVLPNYSTIKAGLPRRTTFCCEHSKDLQLYVLLHWHSYEDKYNLEVGWTYKSTLNDIESHFDPSRAIQFNSVIISLSALSGQNETWYDLRGITRGGVQGNAGSKGLSSIVGSSIQELMSIGIPYLERVSSSKIT